MFVLVFTTDSQIAIQNKFEQKKKSQTPFPTCTASFTTPPAAVAPRWADVALPALGVRRWRAEEEADRGGGVLMPTGSWSGCMAPWPNWKLAEWGRKNWFFLFGNIIFFWPLFTKGKYIKIFVFSSFPPRQLLIHRLMCWQKYLRILSPFFCNVNWVPLPEAQRNWCFDEFNDHQNLINHVCLGTLNLCNMFFWDWSEYSVISKFF